MSYGEANKAGIHELVRLESRTSTNKSLSVQLQANVHDALWLLSRQYDVGEFKGEDTGSAIQSVVSKTTKSINKIKTDIGVIELSSLELLEPKVEKLNPKINILARLQMGKYWKKLLIQSSLFVKYGSMCFDEFKFDKTLLIDNEQDIIESNANLLQISILVNGKNTDGWILFNEIINSGTINGYGSINIDAPDIVKFNECEAKLMAWVYKNYIPTGTVNNDKTWQPESLEYSFECSAQENSSTTSTDQTVLKVNDYQSGKLDWYNFSLPKTTTNHGNNSSTITQSTTTHEYLPSKMSYKGAMSARWWEFDDAMIDLSNSKFKNHDITKILTINHLLNFSHDWKIIPIEIPMGTIVDIDTIKVKDVFGDETVISQMPVSNNWNMFALNQEGDLNGGDIEGRLFVPPSVVKRIESKPIEKVIFIKDEMANMVWAIEKVIPSVFSGGENGDETAKLLQKYYEEKDASTNPIITNQVKSEATKAFNLSNQMPENWIPFLPVQRLTNSINFQRSTFYRILNGFNTKDTIRPRTNLLLADGDKLPETPTPYYIKEEEILQNGITIKTSYQRARDYNGSVRTWLGRDRENGESKKSSDLKFDTITPFIDTESSLISANNWLLKADISSGVADAAIFASEDDIFIISGIDGEGQRSQVLKFNPNANILSSLDDWSAMSKCLGVYNGSEGYVMAGYQGDPTSISHELYRYSIEDDSWEQISDFPINNGIGGVRLNAVFVENNGKLFYGLGDRDGDILDDWWEYNLDTNSWIYRASFPTPITEAAYFVIHDEIYVLGGKTDSSVTFDSWKYNIENDEWIQIESIPNHNNEVGLYQSGGFTLNNYGFVCCGAFTSSRFSEVVWLYDPENDSWCKFSDFPGSNSKIQSCTIVSNNKAYVIGGYKQDGTVCEDIWEFTF